MEIGYKTDTGRKRARNEDRVVAIELSRRLQKFACGLFIVADGMGGHNAGEIASRIACRVVTKKMLPALKTSTLPIPLALIKAIRDANEYVHNYALQHPKCKGMGTTMTVCAVYGRKLYVGHVGDSRAYRFVKMKKSGGGNSVQDLFSALFQKSPAPVRSLLRNLGLIREKKQVEERIEIKQLTHDHSVVQELLDEGKITIEQARHHPRKNLITRAVGIFPIVDVDIVEDSILPDSRYLLCTDGLSNHIDDKELGDMVMRYPPQKACDELVRLANERGGEDNISVVIIKP